MAPTFATAHWNDLVCWSWPVEPERARKLAHYGFEPDLMDNAAWVSLVAFSFRKLRVLGLPALFHRNFAEVNLRLYVKNDREEPGVAFLKELVPSLLVTRLANRLFRESYERRLGLNARPFSPKENARYLTFQAPKGVHLEARGEGPWKQAGEDPKAIFFSNRTFAAPLKAKRPLLYRVDHPEWRFLEAEFWSLRNLQDLFEHDPLLDLTFERPASVLIFEGSRVSVHWPVRAES